MHGLTLLAGVAFLTLTGVVFAILAGRVTSSTELTMALDVALISAWLIRRTHPRASVALTLATGSFAFPLLSLLSGGLAAPALIAIPMVPVIVASFAGARGASWLAALLTLGVLGIAIVTALHRVPPSPLSEEARHFMAGALVVASTGFAVYVVRAGMRERERLEAALDARSREYYERSVHDPLTGLYNRRYLEHRLDEEVAFAARHGSGLGVVVLDVDHFKHINDAHGHAGGDEVLTALARAVEAGVRREDVVARFGGEEFAIVLRGLDLAAVTVAAERVRRSVEQHAFVVDGRPLPVTVSVGCASVTCCDELSAAGLCAVADARMYRAKRSGRNRVVAADEPLQEAPTVQRAR